MVRAFLAGSAGMVVAVLEMAALRVVAGLVTLPEAFGESLIFLLPGEVFSRLLDTLGYYGKPLLTVSLTVVQVVLGGLAALGLVRAAGLKPGDQARAISVLLAASVAIWVALVAIVLPALAPSYFRPPAGYATLALLVEMVSYGMVTGWLMGRQAAPGPAVEPGRRRLLLVAVGGLAVLGLGGLVKLLADVGRGTPPSARSYGRLPPEVTPNADFYLVSKNVVDPTVKVDGWKLSVGGLVERPYELTYDELKSLPSVEQYTTLECISNEVGGDLISNALWRGVRLSLLLERAGLKDGVVDVVLRAADDYSDGIPLEKALHPGTLVAWEMNGEPLPDRHGFPARLIVPGIYGMKNVKWLTAIEAVGEDYRGFWERQGWDDVAQIKTMSRIDVPEMGSTLGMAPVMVGGIAFAGDRSISAVEVSFDDGKTWQPAQLRPSLGPYTWVIWTAEWRPDRTGGRMMRVRAKDGKGRWQEAEFTDPYPSGATGLHGVYVLVAEG